MTPRLNPSHLLRPFLPHAARSLWLGMLAALSLAAPAPWSGSQDAAAAGEDAAPASQGPDESIETAPRVDPAESVGRTLLEQAARYQSPERRVEAPESLYGAFTGTIATPDGTGSVSIERWFTRSPERLLTRHVESFTGSRQTIGWDGEQAWFRDDGSGDVVVYTDDAELFAVDLERLAEQRRLTRLLLDALVLDTLIPRLTDVRAGDETRWTDLESREHPVRHVRASLPDELYPAPKLALPPGSRAPERRLDVDLLIDTDTGALWRVVVAAVGRDDVAALELQFDFHGRTRSGLRVPGNVRVFRVGETDELARLGVEFDQDDHLVLDIDGQIDPAVFEVPDA